MDRQTDGRMDRQTDGRTDQRMDGMTDGPTDGQTKAKVGHVVGDMLEGNCNNFNHFRLSYFDLK